MSDKEKSNVIVFPGKPRSENEVETKEKIEADGFPEDLADTDTGVVSLLSRQKPKPRASSNDEGSGDMGSLLERVFAARMAGDDGRLKELAREHLTKRIPRQTALRLKRFLDNNRGLNSSPAYSQALRDAQEWDDETIRGWIVDHEDKWKTKPAFFAALYDIAHRRRLIGII